MSSYAICVRLVEEKERALQTREILSRRHFPDKDHQLTTPG